MDITSIRKRIADMEVLNAVIYMHLSVIAHGYTIWHNVIHWITVSLYDKKFLFHQH